MLKGEYNKGLVEFYEDLKETKLQDKEKVAITILYNQFKNGNKTVMLGRSSNKGWLLSLFQVFILYNINN